MLIANPHADPLAAMAQFLDRFREFAPPDKLWHSPAGVACLSNSLRTVATHVSAIGSPSPPQWSWNGGMVRS